MRKTAPLTSSTGPPPRPSSPACPRAVTPSTFPLTAECWRSGPRSRHLDESSRQPLRRWRRRRSARRRRGSRRRAPAHRRELHRRVARRRTAPCRLVPPSRRSASRCRTWLLERCRVRISFGSRSRTSTSPTWLSAPALSWSAIASSTRRRPSFTCASGSPSIEPETSTTNVTIAGFLTAAPRVDDLLEDVGREVAGLDRLAAAASASRPHFSNCSLVDRQAGAGGGSEPCGP